MTASNQTPDSASERIAHAMQLAGALYNQGKWREAEQICRAVAGVRPGCIDALNLLGIITAQTERTAEAVDLLERAIGAGALDPTIFNNYGSLLRDLGRPRDALPAYERAQTLKPDFVEAHFNHGNTLHELGRREEALASYRRAVSVRPAYAEAHYNIGVTLHECGRPDEALANFERALQIRPDYAEAYNSLGNALRHVRRFEEALGNYENALRLKPDYVDAWNNRGAALRELERTSEALESYARALALAPDSAEVHNNIGNVQRQLYQFPEALECYERALRLQPDYAEAHCNLGNLLQDLRRCEQALVSYGRAVQIRPDFAEAHFNQGNALRELQRFEEAFHSYALALRYGPRQRWLYGSWLHTKMQLCDWSELPQQISQLVQWIGEGRTASLPFFLLGLTDSPVLQRQAARIWVKEVRASTPSLPELLHYAGHGRIRVGYYSADFHSHATAYLAAEMFELHDRERFELVAFSFGSAPRADRMRSRLAAAFDRFLEIGTMSDVQVAHLSRELQIDIAVDLKGFTQNERSRIFACRAAPLQVSYLGYPATLGADYMDYLIADRTLIPDANRADYAEKIAYLPHSYQANDRQRPIATRRFARAELDLPSTGFVFCCFNNAYKITPQMFDSWMRILTRVPGSVLWLLQDSRRAAENLRHEARARGVSEQRLIFAPRLDLPEHLARQRAADLFLDTLPCNAHTTASDALWVGLPVLTCMGESFVGRVAGSLLNAIGLAELITATVEQYEALAVELAGDPQRLAAIRARLADNRLRAPLFDTQLFTRHIEQAYTRMYQRQQHGLPPDHFFVEP